VAGAAQVWRIAAGQVLGVAAVLPPAVAEDVEALRLADPNAALPLPGTVTGWEAATVRCSV